MINPLSPTDQAKWRQLLLLAVIQWLAMTLWFSASAVNAPLKKEWNLSSGAEAWLTISVQLGFVIGALGSAVFNLADRISPPRLMAACSLIGAGLNAAIGLWISYDFGKTDRGFLAVVLLRMATGVMLAGVYPVGMKLMATWFVRGRGLAIGVLVGALTIGSASPHLVKAFWPDKWRTVMLVSSLCAVLAAALAATVARTGPHLPKAAKFDWTYFARIWRDEAVRRANFGYLGHMFELYAMWAWAPALVAESLHVGGYTPKAEAMGGFAVVAAGAAGCVLAGLWADRVGRTWTTIASLIVSGSCALVAGSLLLAQPLLLVAVCIVWGFAVVADSAQFSTAVSELCDPRYVGTALTVQTCAGFLLTTLTIRAVPAVFSATGSWAPATAMLALGPLFGIYHMAMLRQMREAEKMAGGMR